MTAARALAHRITLNSVWLFAGRVVSQALSALMLIVLARVLGAEGLGRYALITSVVFIANTLTTFGTDTLIIREVARDPAGAQRRPVAALLIQIVLSLVLMGAIWIIPVSQPSLRLYTISLLPLAISTVYSAVLRGRERMDLYTMFSVASAALQVLGVAAVLNAGSSLPTLMVGQVVAHTLAAIIAATAVHRLLPDFPIRWRLDRVLVRQMLIAGLPLMLLMGLSIVYQRIGVLTLASIGGNEMTGQFSAAARLVEALKMVPAAMLGAMFPVLAREGQITIYRGSERKHVAVQQSFGLIGFALVAAVIVSLLAAPIIIGLFGSEYLPAVPVLRLLGWSLIPYVIGAVLSLQMVASHRERNVLIAVALTLLAAIVLHYTLIKAHGLLGAGEATIASETLQAVILLVLARRR